ncbi:MAG: OmpA family protein [Bacteroidota bacterium]
MRALTKASFLVIMSILVTSCGVEKKIMKSYVRGEYQTSIDLSKEALAKNPDNANLNIVVAESYRQSNRIRFAEPYYKKAIDRKYKNDTIPVGLYYGLAMKANGKYNEAREQLDNYVEKAEDEDYVKKAEEQIQNLGRIESMLEKESYYKVKNLDAINTAGAEYSPVYNDGQLFFTSARENDKIYKATGTPYTNLFKVNTRGARVDMATVQGLGEIFNTNDINEGTITFSPNGKTVIFARGNTAKSKSNDLTDRDVNLYISRFRNQRWTTPRILSRNVNAPGYWNSTPAFSRDGRTLYFASNRPRKRKGRALDTDIFSARMDSRGRFGKAKRLGSEINTYGNEMFPHISDDGHLYFSSDGHPGFGGLDIYVAQRRNGQTIIENLGKPVNSESDDFGMFLYKPDRGFFSSNREGGKGDDDIYTFVNEDPNLRIVNYYLRGITMTHDEEGELKVLPSVDVKLLDYKGDSSELRTGNDGKFLFRVYEHEHYTVVGEKKSTKVRYLTTRMPYTTVGKSVPQEELTKLETDVYLDTVLVIDKYDEGVTFVLENIYFDFDSSVIREDAADELDRLVTLLKDNPQIAQIEMSSHTDSVGNDRYNELLSQRRADATVKYLIEQGIDKKRLTAKGYGENRPIARNTNPDGTDNPEGRQKNRRTEFQVLKIQEVEKANPGGFDEDRFFDDDDESSGGREP